MQLPTFPALDADVQADVCVIGAGIAGLSVAYLLARAGKSVVVIDDGGIGSGMTAVTSAHLSRMRMLDVADGAALSAANALDDTAYRQGVGASVPLSNASVQERAAVRPPSSPARRRGPRRRPR